MEPNAVFCVLDEGDSLAPRPEAVKEHCKVDAIWIKVGTTFAGALKAMKEYTQVPPASVFSYLRDGRWYKIRAAELGQMIEPGETYYFRIFAAGFKRRLPLDLRYLQMPLHRIFLGLVQLGNVSRRAFEAFMNKSSTRRLCKEMVSILKQISSTPKVEEQETLRREFEARFAIGLCVVGEAPSCALTRSAGALVLKEETGFFAMLTIKPGTDGFIQSRSLPLAAEQEVCLKELGFVFWVTHLLMIRPTVEVGEQLTLMDGATNLVKVVRAVQSLSRNPVSNLVLRVTDGKQEMVLKVGHSPRALELIEDLCVDSQVSDQTEAEARILHKLGGCCFVPPVHFSGYWGDSPVVLTELQGSSLEESVVTCGMLDNLCKDLTSSVMELQVHRVAHGDINPRNVGVYARPDEHQGRLFYLYDYGFALELPRGKDEKVAANAVFSAADTLSKGVVSLITELTSVVYVCLALAGMELPWQSVCDWGPQLGCELREGLLTSERTTQLSFFSRGVRDWFAFVLSQPSDADFESVRQAATRMLGVQLPQQGGPLCKMYATYHSVRRQEWVED